MSATTPNHLAILAACVLTLVATGLRADQLQMQNGDHYSGKILSMTSNSIVLESDVLGKITLPREKVASLTMGTSTAANTTASATIPTIRTPRASMTNTDVAAALRRMGANTNFIQQVREQMLKDANPEANQKYDELVGGLMSGKLSASDIRSEAKKSIVQIQQLKQELGPQSDDLLDSYLAILEKFVNEAEPPKTAAPAAVAAPAAPANFGTNSPATSVAK